jgi:hypothetical protein
MRKRLRVLGKAAFLRVHTAMLGLGVIVLPKHYYAPVPDIRELRRTRERWARRSDMRGVDVDLDRQLAALRAMAGRFEPEYRSNAAFRHGTEGGFGPGFGFIEAQALHGVIRGARPSSIIEVGSGVSTHCLLNAVELNAAEGSPCSITCIEPHPSGWLNSAPVTLIPEPVQTVGLGMFDSLAAGDLLFIDSTHAVRTGGDVVHIVLSILPRLRPGVIVHFHDIYLPYDFQRDADHSLFQWMETALLHAYLVDNARMGILFCLSQLHYDQPEALREIFPEYRPEPHENGLRTEPPAGRHFPSSLYLQVQDPAGGPAFAGEAASARQRDETVREAAA